LVLKNGVSKREIWICDSDRDKAMTLTGGISPIAVPAACRKQTTIIFFHKLNKVTGVDMSIDGLHLKMFGGERNQISVSDSKSRDLHVCAAKQTCLEI